VVKNVSGSFVVLTDENCTSRFNKDPDSAPKGPLLAKEGEVERARKLDRLDSNFPFYDNIFYGEE